MEISKEKEIMINYIFYGQIILYIFFKIADTITTYIGLSRGFVEIGPLMVFFLSKFNLIQSLAISTVYVAVLLFGLVWIYQKQERKSKTSNQWMIIGGIILINIMAVTTVTNNLYWLLNYSS